MWKLRPTYMKVCSLFMFILESNWQNTFHELSSSTHIALILLSVDYLCLMHAHRVSIPKRKQESPQALGISIFAVKYN